VLRTRLRWGQYDALGGANAFADVITGQLREMSHDKQLRVEFSPEAAPLDHGRRHAPDAANNGFEKTERLEGNVGYLAIREFADAKTVARTAAAAMTSLNGTDALILDLRQNEGGDPLTVALVASYFFDSKPVHLNDLHFRKGKQAQVWTQRAISGPRYGRMKSLYILTSKDTFAGGEELTYDLQTQKRAMIVGETTGGGANPVDAFRLSDHFALTLAVGHAVNPITKASWEGLGVRPDVSVSADQARATAHLMALEELVAKTGDPKLKQERADAIKEIKAKLRPANAH
jgi:C-terminal processing protease CtpA/Prc